MKNIFIACLVWLCPITCFAQTYEVEMVSNLNPSAASNPRWMTVMNNTMYFFANDGVNGYKIFSLSANANATPQLCPNITGAAVFGDGANSTHNTLPVMNNKLYLPVLGPSIGRELYTYDAINIPSIVMDIYPGNGSAAPAYMIFFGGKLYFQANNGLLGTELWMHDPATNTTQCLSDINTGLNNSTVAFITPYNGKLYFAASNGNDTIPGHTGIELYRYDPANNTVNLVMDIYPGNIGSTPTGLMTANNKLYFVATDPLYGKELYEYNDTVVTRLTDVNPGPAQGIYTSDQAFPTWYNGCIYFCANEPNNDMNLGEYHIQSQTTNIIHCSGAGVSGTPRYFKVWDNKFFFSNYSATSGIELWAKDSNNAPYQVWNINPGQAAGYPKFFTEFNNNLYFNAYNDTSTGEELFRLTKKVDTVITNPNFVTDHTNLPQIQLAPNPVKNMMKLTLISTDDLTIRCLLTDLSGRIILQTAAYCGSQGQRQEQSIDCTGLSTGTYLVFFYNSDHRLIGTQKVIKE